MQKSKIKPDIAVIVTTIKALKISWWSRKRRYTI